MPFPPTLPSSNRFSTYPTSVPAQDHDQLTSAVTEMLTEMGSFDRATTGFEVYPACAMNNGTFSLTSGTQYYTYFRALKSITVTQIKFTVGAASTTTTHAWVGIYDVDSSNQPTTLLVSSSDLTTFATTTASAYTSGSGNNNFSISWTPDTLYKRYCLGLLWVGTGTPAVRGRTIDGSTGAGGGFSTLVGTAFASKHSTTGLSALVPTGNPATTAANLATGATGIQMGPIFLP